MQICCPIVVSRKQRDIDVVQPPPPAHNLHCMWQSGATANPRPTRLSQPLVPVTKEGPPSNTFGSRSMPSYLLTLHESLHFRATGRRHRWWYSAEVCDRALLGLLRFLHSVTASPRNHLWDRAKGGPVQHKLRFFAVEACVDPDSP